MHSDTATALATCALAMVQFSVAAFGCVWLNGHAAMNAGPTAVLNTVMLTITAAGLIGMPQLVAAPPCDVKLPAGFAAIQLRVWPADSVPPAPKRVSTIRHGTSGVYTRSSPASPNVLA